MSGRVLLLGGSGLIGGALFRQLGPERAVATYRTNAFDGSLHFDALETPIDPFLDGLGSLSHAVLLFGESGTEFCARNREKARTVNVQATQRVINALIDRSIKPVLFSSDGVFDGVEGSYDESQRPTPLMEYGKQKIEAEDHLRAACEDYLILRPARAYSRRPGRRTMLDKWRDSLSRGERIFCATDNRFCPIDLDDLAAMVDALITKNCCGIYHAAGPQPVTHWSLLQMFLSEMGVDEGAVDVSLKSIQDFSPYEPRPLDTTLDNSKIRAESGIDPISPAEVCREFVRRIGGIEPPRKAAAS
jgi:dTDP-4-dehydrorhamnose reductase